MARNGHDPGTRPANEGRRPFLRRWVGLVTLGEAAGFLVPASAGVLSFGIGTSPPATHALLVVAGAGEGALLGIAQAIALTRSSVPVAAGRWVAATAAAAAVAWAFGMTPVTVGAFEPGRFEPTAASIAVVALGALSLLAAIPVAQWVVLRDVLPRAWRWIPLTMLALALGLVATALPSPVVNERTPVVVLMLLYGAAGLLMALVVAVVTGFGLCRMIRCATPGRAP